MEPIKIKHRLFERVEDISNSSFVASYKGKNYEVLIYDPSTQEGDMLSYCCKRLSSSGVKCPKVKWIDKKAGYIVRELIQGPTVMEVISKQDLDDDILHQLFYNEYMAKVNHMTLNYEIDKWMIVNNKLYYMEPSFVPYQEDIDLIKKSLRLWFNTKELVMFLAQNGLTFDKKRLKDEYSTNKEMVLATIKHYR